MTRPLIYISIHPRYFSLLSPPRRWFSPGAVLFICAVRRLSDTPLCPPCPPQTDQQPLTPYSRWPYPWSSHIPPPASARGTAPPQRQPKEPLHYKDSHRLHAPTPTCMADVVFPLTIDDTSPLVQYSPFGDTTTGSPAIGAGWNAFDTSSGFASWPSGSGLPIGPTVANGTSLHLTAADGAAFQIDWNGTSAQLHENPARLARSVRVRPCRVCRQRSRAIGRPSDRPADVGVPRERTRFCSLLVWVRLDGSEVERRCASLRWRSCSVLIRRAPMWGMGASRIAFTDGDGSRRASTCAR